MLTPPAAPWPSPITRVALCVVIRNPFARPAGGARLYGLRSGTTYVL